LISQATGFTGKSRNIASARHPITVSISRVAMNGMSTSRTGHHVSQEARPKALLDCAIGACSGRSLVGAIGLSSSFTMINAAAHSGRCARLSMICTTSLSPERPGKGRQIKESG